MVSVNRLMVGGVAGLFVCFGLHRGFRHQVSHKIKSTKSCKEAIDLLKEHKGAKYLLGEPIQDHLAKFNSLGELFGSPTEVKVSVAGPKSTGLLFFTLDSKDDLNAVQLQIGSDDSKRLVIKKSVEEINASKGT